jgi:chaperonin GroES
MTPAQEGTLKVKIHPLADRVVIRPFEETERVRRGLHLPDTARDKPHEGEVVAPGPGRIEEGKRVPMGLEVGQKVLYEKYGGMEVTLDGHQFLVIDESEVLGIIA